MNNFKWLLIFSVGLLMLSSCSKKLFYFTEEMKESNRWSEREIKRIQFYLSEDIVLVRSRRGSSSNIEDGKIKIKDKNKVEQIKFKKGTPGTALFLPKEDRIAISFEAGNDKYLMFGPNRKAKGRFVLLAKDWDRNIGKISYDGKVYETTSESAYAALLVQMSGDGDVTYKSRSAEGRKVRKRR